ncbi:MAG: hypothetical protein ACREJB_04835, partial [Planctomycetaceae bacterium]
LATGSYDQTILLWDAKTGRELRTLTGHNGAVFDLAFHPEGRLLASASGDRTVKLWDVETGARLDTFTEPEKEQYALAFSPDGRRIAAAGVDNRIRIWRSRRPGFSEKPGFWPIQFARFAHEAPILELAWSPDGRTLVSSAEDRTLKLWDARRMALLRTLEEQPDWAAALAVAPDSGAVLAGRLDGTLAVYPLRSGEERVELPEPILTPPVPQPHDGPMPEQLPQVAETEPNDEPAAATPLAAPITATGALAAGEADLFRFESQAGTSWIIETNAERSKSPADTRIEVLHEDGTPVLRYLLRAVRDSYITFRPIDSTSRDVRVKNWQEMELNQYMYMAGEICRIFRMPQGPDSGFQFYVVGGKRRDYFDTSATTHALDESVYIVEPYPPGTELTDNGLPVFPLYYANDDSGDRKLGSDSRLTFTAPQDGVYLVRVTDVRGFGGKDFTYSLSIRPPQPDFNVTIKGKGAAVPKGSGQRLTFALDRIDGFEGDVRIDIANVPEDFTIATPVVVQAGHLEAESVIHAAPDAEPGRVAPNDWKTVTITASATVAGREVTKPVDDLGAIKLADPPKLTVHLEPDDGSHEDEQGNLVIAPGETITAMLRIERNGYDGELNFDVDNLPHGVIVDNIGLSGILIRDGEDERQIFLTAADWVPETARHIHAVSKGQGNQASRPIGLRVRAAE